MAYPGFVPVRQLVLVDLLSVVVAVRPGQRAVVAIDGLNAVSRRRVVAEIAALAEHVAGRGMSTVAMDAFSHVAPPQTYAGGQAFYRSAFDYGAFNADVLHPFRAGADDAILLVDGVFLHRPELVSCWDASVFVRTGDEASHPLNAYLDQSPDLQATWVLDVVAPTAPLLTFGAIVEPHASESPDPRVADPGSRRGCRGNR